MIGRCVSYASFIDTIALLLCHERFFLLLLESFALMKLSPLEVDRYLYKFDYSNTELYTSKFPAPREVDRYLYGQEVVVESFEDGSFPAPFEVDR